MSDEKKISLQEVTSFLLGDGELDGHSFGEVPEWGTQYWWRRYLRKALSQPAAVEGVVEGGSDTKRLQFWCDAGADGREQIRKHFTDSGIDAWRRAVDIVMGETPAPTLPQSEDARGAEVEFTDSARAALLWVLWHHQGGSSKVGQPIRFALGMGQHEHLSDEQIAAAKSYADFGESVHAPASGLLSEKVEPQPAYQVEQIIGGVSYWLDVPKHLFDCETLSKKRVLYKLPPTAQQALRMAADAVRKVRDGLSDHRQAEGCSAAITAIEQLTPPTDPYQQARAEGFAVGVAQQSAPIGWLVRGGGFKPAAECEWEYRHGPDEPYLSWAEQEKIPVYRGTPPTDAVTMTREVQQTTWDWRENARQLITNPEIAVSAFGYEWLSDVARAALNDAWDLRTEFESTALDVALATEQLTFDKRMRSGNIADRVDIDECRAIVAQHMPKESK